REPRIQVQRADDGLEAVREDRLLVAAGAPLLRATEPHQLAQAELARALSQAAPVHQRRARAREIAFGPARLALEQQRRDRQPEHRVAEELEALVAATAVLLVGIRRMGERRLRQLRIPEDVTDRLLESQAVGVARPAHASAPPPSTTSPCSKTADWPG